MQIEILAARALNDEFDLMTPSRRSVKFDFFAAEVAEDAEANLQIQNTAVAVFFQALTRAMPQPLGASAFPPRPLRPLR